MNPNRIRRCIIKPEEIWSTNAEENEGSVKVLQGCKNSQPANSAGCEISQSANFAGCEISPHCSLLTAFLTRLFMVLYKFSLDVILVYLHIFVISLLLGTYISSFFLVNQSILQSINQSIKFGTKLPLPLLVCDFLSLSFTLLHFITS